MLTRFYLSLLLSCTLPASAGSWVFNNPYPEDESQQAIYYTSFSEQPKTLDPAKSYSANEYQFIAQIYEPVLQYDYLARPYTLIPLTASSMPQVHYYDEQGLEVTSSQTSDIAHTTYTIHIQPGIYYQPHPAFAKNRQDAYIYHDLTDDFLDDQGIYELSDFKYTGTRELIADDYLYQIKRLANPTVNSPIYGLMSEYIEGFRTYANTLPKQSLEHHYIDLRDYPLKGAHKIDDYTFEITIKGYYPQFIFWLSMPFFSPVPWEVERFYAQPDMDDKNLSLGWYPVGTGPFMLVENNPNSQMVLEKNPHFHEAYFPSQSNENDRNKGYLHHKGARLPLIEKAVYTLEKEAIPRWNKFLQGYYDLSGVSADSFDQAIQITPRGQAVLTPELQKKGVYLTQMTDPAIYYLGFNMLDEVVGGYTLQAKKLRQAISIAVNYDEFIAIFLNGRGSPAQGPIPPGIFGHREGREGINPYVYLWKNQSIKRRSLKEAQQLMKEAGFPGGRDPKTRQPLILHYDVPAAGGPDDKAQLNWMRKQFAKIGIALNVRATQYNRFQEKMRNGNAQLFGWGWNADYPDPENFLFLLYGPNGKVNYGGENAANYENKIYDRLFDKMKREKNDVKRQQLIDQMMAIIREDAPWVWGMNTQSLILSQQWVAPMKPNTMYQNTLKYMFIDVALRNTKRNAWNSAVLWPIGLFGLLFFSFFLPFLIAYRRRQRSLAERVRS